MDTNENARFEAAYSAFLEELDNLQLFVYAERSHAGRTSLRGRGWLKQSDRNTAYTIEKLGKMAGLRSPLLQVVMAILRGMNPHASRAEWSAKLFQDARSSRPSNEGLSQRSVTVLGVRRTMVAA